MKKQRSDAFRTLRNHLLRGSRGIVPLILILQAAFTLASCYSSDSHSEANRTQSVSAGSQSVADSGASHAAPPGNSQNDSGPIGPALFFSDLDSGPSSGNSDTSHGQNSGEDGAIVSVWGARLGDAQGNSQVLVNGSPVKRVYFWGSAHLDNFQKVVFQIPRTVPNGPSQITVVVGGMPSNAIPFTVRPGNIYFAGANGKIFGKGTFNSPWKGLLKARNSMRPGDITYVLDGVAQETDDGEGWDSSFTLRSGHCSANGYPRALVAYPGATATIGSEHSAKPATGIRTTDFSAGEGSCAGGWTFAGLRFRGIAPVAISGPSHQWRFVGNDISCPHSDGSGGGGACFEASLASGVIFYGNTVHDAGTAGASALFQGVYFSTDTNHIDMGWNTVRDVHGCRGIQIHSSPLGSGYPKSGYDMFDIRIHDNLIHDTQCDGIILDTIDPSKGPVLLYNNVIYNAGKGPNNPEHTGGWSCINVRGSTENGPPGSGDIEIFNNTLFSCGTFAQPPYGSANASVVVGGNGKLRVQLRNNIFSQAATSLFPSGVPYLVLWNPTASGGGAVCAPSDNCYWSTGTNNLFFGSGAINMNLSNITGAINADPRFRDARNFDFHLSAQSPAARAGTRTPATADHDGVPLPRGSSYPVGAYTPTD